MENIFMNYVDVDTLLGDEGMVQVVVVVAMVTRVLGCLV
jgi:hypothetical protein